MNQQKQLMTDMSVERSSALGDPRSSSHDRVVCVLYRKYVYLKDIYLSKNLELQITYIYLFRERGREGKREGEKH